MTASRRLAPKLLLIGLAALGALLLTPEVQAQSRDSGSDFALHPENADPKSIWSDGETLWVGDDRARKVFAYKLWDDPGTEASEYGTRDPGRDVPSLGQEDFHVTGHGPRLYVAEEALDGASRDVFGYDLTSLTRQEDRDFVYGGPNVAGGVMIVRGTATDGRHLWITDTTPHAHAFRLFDDPETPEDEYGRPDASRKLTMPGKGQLRGLFTDGRTMWGVRFASDDASVRSVKVSDGTEAGYDFPLHEDNDHAYGIWSDGETFYVVDEDDAMIYTYHGGGGGVRPTVEDAETAAALVGNTGQSGDAGHDLGPAGAKRAQAFTTGNNNAGYALASIGIEFDDVSDPSSAPADLEATLNADSGGVPGDALCALAAPASLSERSVNTFTAPASATTCPALVKETTYFVVVERVRATGSGAIAVGGTASDAEDPEAAEGWSIADGSAAYSPQAAAQGWAPDAFSYKIEVRGSSINNPAAGEATVTGTAQVGETLTADASGISDADGLDDVSYSYQWLAGGSDIAGATGSSYTLTSSEQGQTVQVKVTFNDDADNAESLTSVATETVAAKPNNPATGAPTISGTPQVGETLTASTSNIADTDELTNVSYSYQWTAGGADIDGATGSSYTLTSSEQGQTVQVRVTFTDDADNQESLTSAETLAVAAKPNTAATGQPAISGTPQVDETLTADTSAISDEDGLANVSYQYQWLRDDADIAGQTNSTYQLVSADQDKTIKVRVTFRDDADNAESLTSIATTAVAPQRTSPLTASFANVPADHDGSNFTFDLTFSENVNAGYARIRDDAFTVSGGAIASAVRKEQGSNQGWTVEVDPTGNGAVSITLPETTDCHASGAICTEDSRKLSHPTSATVAGPPAISVSDAAVQEAEGAVLVFTATLSHASSRTVTVDYATSDGTAVAGSDYTAASGALTFNAGDTSQTVQVTVLTDSEDEGQETLTLTLCPTPTRPRWTTPPAPAPSRTADRLPEHRRTHRPKTRRRRRRRCSSRPASRTCQPTTTAATSPST